MQFDVEQIDLRRQRAKDEHYQIEKKDRKKIFGEYSVTNPRTGGSYLITIRGFERGDNRCTCPDFRLNSLGTCKHIEAVLQPLLTEHGKAIAQRKATLTYPELDLDFRAPLRLRIFLPKTYSDRLKQVTRKYFDDAGYWSNSFDEHLLLEELTTVPESVTWSSDAKEFFDWQIDRKEMANHEAEWRMRLQRNPELFTSELLNVPLYEYQAEGAIFLACRGRSILGDDMGLGKTVQTLAAVELLARVRPISKVLVVAPASVKYQWASEIAKFTHRDSLIIEGDREDRERMYQQAAFYKLVNYEQVIRDLESINNWSADLIVLDEAQRIKNWESKTSRDVKRLKSKYAFVLTGTPIENRLEELYSIVSFVDGRRLGPAYQFLREHQQIDAHGQVIGYRDVARIREKLAPIFLRRTREEVLTQLPERTETTRFVELSEAQRGPYNEEKIALARLLSQRGLTKEQQRQVLAHLINMRMLCDSTFLFDEQTHHSPKLEEFRELVPEYLTDSASKLLVFSQWETMLRETSKVLDELNLTYVLLHGGLQGPERKRIIERFRDDPECRVLLSTDSGGVGLNLQMADTVLNLELPWNPATLNQRISRVHRMGQDRPVRVVHFITRGTIEERVQALLKSKQAVFDGLFDSEDAEIEFRFQSNHLTSQLREVLDLERAKNAEAKPIQEAPAQRISVIDPNLASATVQMVEAALKLVQLPGWNEDLLRRLKIAVTAISEELK
jgi:SNF2 family DNA or RNA helicase